MIYFGYRRDLLSGGLGVALDHSRWIAALAVCVAHLRNLLFPDAGSGVVLNEAGKTFYFFTLFGTQAVVAFFVISGLLVGGSVVRLCKERRFEVKSYALDRITRLYVVLVPAITLSLLLYSAGLTKTCSETAIVIPTLVNILSLQNFVSQPLCNNHPLWSLSSEAFFYVAAPCLLIALINRSTVAIAGSGLIFFACWFSWDGTYMSPAFGLVLWCVGLVPWFVRIDISPLLPLGVFGSVLALTRLHFINSDFTADVLLALSFAAFLSSRFSARVRLSGLAKSWAGFSYSLYLVHMPLAQAVASLLDAQMNPTVPLSYVVYAVCLTLILAVAWVFGLLFENSTARLRDGFRRYLISTEARLAARPALSDELAK